MDYNYLPGACRADASYQTGCTKLQSQAFNPVISDYIYEGRVARVPSICMTARQIKAPLLH